MRLVSIFLFAASLPGAAARPDGVFNAVYRGASADWSSVGVSEKGGPQLSLPVTDPAVQAEIRDRYQAGDRITVTLTGGVVQQITPETVQVTLTDRLLVLGVCLAVHLIFGFIVLGSRFKGLLIGLDNRYSNSKFQMALWFGILAVTYLSATFLRWAVSGYTPEFAGGVNIPNNLLLLSGISVLSYGAAKGITSSKQAQATAAANAPQPEATIVAAQGVAGAGVAVVPPPPAPAAPPPPKMKMPASRPLFPQDLLCDDDGNPDIGDYQMLAVTAIALGAYVTQIIGFLGSIQLLHHVTIPDVDTTILATFGLGQGAYLAKKQLGD